VLVIDNERAFAHLTVRYLISQGFHAEFALDGRTGLAAACAGAWDVILLDLKMPGFDGFDVLRGLRERKVEGRVMLLTAYPSFEAGVEAMKLGAVDCRTKGLSDSELVAAILAVARAEPAPESGHGPVPSDGAAVSRLEHAVTELRQMEGSLQHADDPALRATRERVVQSLCGIVADADLGPIEWLTCSRALHAAAVGSLLPLTLLKVRSLLEQAVAQVATPVDSRVEFVVRRLAKAGHSAPDIDEATLAAQVDARPASLRNLFTAHFEMSFAACRAAILLRPAAVELARGDEHIRQIGFSLGYSDPSHLTRGFRDCFGLTPTQFRHFVRGDS
jgi:DNA-binding response OmpR family regulator